MLAIANLKVMKTQVPSSSYQSLSSSHPQTPMRQPQHPPTDTILVEPQPPPTDTRPDEPQPQPKDTRLVEPQRPPTDTVLVEPPLPPTEPQTPTTNELPPHPTHNG